MLAKVTAPDTVCAELLPLRLRRFHVGNAAQM
jgi:hypothetical protein